MRVTFCDWCKKEIGPKSNIWETKLGYHGNEEICDKCEVEVRKIRKKIIKDAVQEKAE